MELDAKRSLNLLHFVSSVTSHFQFQTVDFLKLSNMSKVKKHKSEARCKTGKNISHLSFTKTVYITTSEGQSTSGSSSKQLKLQPAIADQATSGDYLDA